MFCVVERLMVEMKLLTHDCAIEQRDRILRSDHQNLAENFEGAGMVPFLRVRSCQIDENLWRLGREFQGPGQRFTSGLILPIQQIGLSLGMEPSGIRGMGTHLE